MKIAFRLVLTTMLASPCLTGLGQTNDATLLSTNLQDRASYALGLNWGQNFKRHHFDVNIDELLNGIRDGQAGRPKLTDQQAQEAVRSYSQQVQRQVYEANVQNGEAFLVANKNKPGVQTKVVTTPSGTTAELQYRIVEEGNGDSPKTNDLVTVKFTASLVDGTQVDSSDRRGQPLQVRADRVINEGVSEVLQMMKPGAKWEVYLPASLAFRDRGGPNIEPGSALIYQVELVSVAAPKPPTPSEPLTSDIIRVPSQKELEAGAKIEVIKPQDIHKYTNAAAAGTNPALQQNSNPPAAGPAKAPATRPRPRTKY